MIALLSLSALAHNWDHDEAPLTDTLTVHVCLGDFDDAQVKQILQALEAWQAGRSEALRGATWTYVRGADRADGTCAPGNGVNEIYAEDADWFADRGAAGAIATALNDDAAVDPEVDFVWNAGDAWRWSAEKPSKTGEGEISLGMVALHEFGHGLGFNHEDGVVAVMNSTYPNAGDLGGKYRPHGDDYAGLAANRPGPSTGKNLLLGKYVVEPGDAGDSIEAWTTGWTVCQEELDATDGPEAIHATVHETSGPLTATIRWRLSADERCFDGTEHDVGERVEVLERGDPVLVQPDGWDFRAVPEGEYFLCARIDPDRQVAETRDGDNTVRSEATVTVQDCSD